MRGQITLEFLMYVGVALLLVIIIAGASVHEIREWRDNREYALVRDLSLAIQKEIETAASVVDGYERYVTLPEIFQYNINYTVRNSNRTITINTSITESTVFTPYFNGTWIHGTNKITRENGNVQVN